MRSWLLYLLTFWCCHAAAANPLDQLVVLSYHDVREVRTDPLDPYSMEAAELVNQFAWLKENGYTPVSLQQLIDAQRGGKALPAKPVLLTFDDGYRSFYTLVFPLLQLFDYPALLALVGQWLDAPQAGAAAPANAPLLNWDQIRALANSGLVEIASHSFDLHRGVRANAQGNDIAAATTRRYDAASGRYEPDSDYEARLRADMARNVALIERETGRKPRAMVWPYGAYNGTAERIARDHGMSVSVSLAPHSNFTVPGAMHLGRVLIQGNPPLLEFAAELLRPYPPTLLRGARIHLDAVFDTDPARQEEKLSRLLDRVATLGINTVYLSAFHDANGDGVADATYFPSRHLPLRADLLGRAAWQLHTRAGVQVFAWLPALGLDPARRGTGMSALSAADKRRIIETYQDLGRHAAVDGLLFQDELGAGEETDYQNFIQEVLRAITSTRAPLATARSLSIRAATDAATGDRPSATLIAAMQRHDQVLVRSAPATHAQQQWLGTFSGRLPRAPAGKGRVLFDLPSGRDDLADILHALQLQGIGNLSYGPDEFWRDHPRLDRLRPAVSVQSEAR